MLMIAFASEVDDSAHWVHNQWSNKRGDIPQKISWSYIQLTANLNPRPHYRIKTIHRVMPGIVSVPASLISSEACTLMIMTYISCGHGSYI